MAHPFPFGKLKALSPSKGGTGMHFCFQRPWAQLHGSRPAHAASALLKTKIHASQYVYINAECSKPKAKEQNRNESGGKNEMTDSTHPMPAPTDAKGDSEQVERHQAQQINNVKIKLTPQKRAVRQGGFTPDKLTHLWCKYHRKINNINYLQITIYTRIFK
jgi:hypothetical protein